VEVQTESDDKDMGRGILHQVDTVTQVSIKFRKEKKGNKNMGISIEHIELPAKLLDYFL